MHSSNSLCYFTSASTNRKSDFIKELSAPMPMQALPVHFWTKSLLIIFNTRRGRLVYFHRNIQCHILESRRLGCGYWEMKSSLVKMVETYHHLIPSMFGLVPCLVLHLSIPLSTDLLAQLLNTLHSSMAHNFYPCLLTMAGMYIYHSVGFYLFILSYREDNRPLTHTLHLTLIKLYILQQELRCGCQVTCNLLYIASFIVLLHHMSVIIPSISCYP